MKVKDRTILQIKKSYGLIWLTLSLLIFTQNSRADDWLPIGKCDSVISKEKYKLCYNNNHRISLWAYHRLNVDLMTGKTKRTNDYRRDPQVKVNPVGSSDYARTGYDRGHLVPAADMKKTRQIMSESFFMTNMTPQHPGLNRGIWRSLENLTRKLVKKHGEAVVITLSVVTENGSRLPKGITIPSSFAKIIFWPNLQKVLAFQIPNKNHSGLKPRDFQVTVNALESHTGFDFLSALPDSIEETFEDTLSSY